MTFLPPEDSSDPSTGPIEGSMKTAFLKGCVRVPIDRLLLLKTLKPGTKETQKYQQIVASIKEIGLVEPPAVSRVPKQPGHFFLVDGHLRIEAMKDLGKTEVDCLVALSDDTYSYNKRINRLASVQEHKMIMRTVDNGMSVERLSSTLNLSEQTIRRRFRMLDGICEEVIHMLADVDCPQKVFDILREMTDLRQIEAVELMTGQRNFSIMFARALLAASSPEQRVARVEKTPEESGVSLESIERLERELAALQVQIRDIEDNYGPEQCELTIIQNYVVHLLNSASVVRWLSTNRRDYLTEFQNITEMKRLPAT